jgi:protein O-GlcNAc transferase
MSSPLLSIIIPTYNRSRFLEAQLCGLEEQLTDEVEVLVSNNDSPDDTEEMLERRGFHIRYFRQEENIGGVLNVIFLLKKAGGKFILCLSDSDLLADDAVERYLSFFRRNPDVGVLVSECQGFVMNEEGERVDLSVTQKFFDSDKLLSKGADALELVFKRAFLLGGMVFRADLLDFDGVKEYYSSRYPQLFLAGKAAIQADVYYLSEPLIFLREKIPKFWQYSPDYQCGIIIEMAKKLAGRLENGQRALRNIVEFRVNSVFSPLLDARGHSIGTWGRVVKNIAAIPEYRNHWKFWFWAVFIGLGGTKGVLFLRMIVHTVFRKKRH